MEHQLSWSGVVGCRPESAIRVTTPAKLPQGVQIAMSFCVITVFLRTKESDLLKITSLFD